MCVVGSILIHRTVSSELAVVERERLRERERDSERECVCRVFLTVDLVPCVCCRWELSMPMVI